VDIDVGIFVVLFEVLEFTHEVGSFREEGTHDVLEHPIIHLHSKPLILLLINPYQQLRRITITHFTIPLHKELKAFIILQNSTQST